MKTPRLSHTVLALVPSLLFTVLSISACSGENAEDDDSPSTVSPTPEASSIPEVTATPAPSVSPTPEVECPECTEIGPHHVVLKLKWPNVAGAVNCSPTNNPSVVSSPSVNIAEGNLSQHEVYFLRAEQGYVCTATAGEYSHEIHFTTVPTHPALTDGLQLAGSSVKSAPGYAVGHLSLYTDKYSFNGCAVVDPRGDVVGFVEVNGIRYKSVVMGSEI